MSTENDDTPITLNIDEVGSGFESWWALEGHLRYVGKFEPNDGNVSLKQVARDSWHNSRLETGRSVILHAELLLHAPFPTIVHETFEDGKTREDAQAELIEKYGISKYGYNPEHGELATIRFYETTVIHMADTVFTSNPKYDANIINLCELAYTEPDNDVVPVAAGYLSPNASIPPLRDEDPYMNAIQVSPASWHFKFIKTFLKGTFTSPDSYLEFKNMKNIGMPSNSCQYTGWFLRAALHATMRGSERGMLLTILAFCVVFLAYLVVAGIYATLRQLGLTTLMWNDMYEIGLIVQLILGVGVGSVSVGYVYYRAKRGFKAWLLKSSTREPENTSVLGRLWAAKRDKICVPVQLSK